jgi:photosystem II stability/assembly factor-like uncharacterized protein
MTDEQFERDLRATLDGLAREPAPERLVARVSQIPTREPATWTNGVRRNVATRRFGSLFGLLVAGVAIAVLAIIVRPPAGPSIGASPSASVSPASSPSTSSPSTSSPSTSSPSTSTSSPKPHGAAVPAGFEPISATFVSADEGWVLGSAPCNDARCPAIARTMDGGATWSSIPAPRTTIRLPRDQAGPGVSRLRFADPSNGWAFGSDLWATHDGGATWSRVAIPALPAAATVLALETAAGTVHAVAYDPDRNDFPIASSPVGADDWRLAAVRVPVGAGPVPEIQLILSRTSGWVLENDRVVEAGARLEAGVWRAWQPPCHDVAGPALLAASTPSDLAAVCDVGAMSTPQGEQLFMSVDGGTTFGKAGTGPSVSSAVAIATPDRSTIVVAGSKGSGSALVASYDSGRTWSTVQSGGAVLFADLGFTTETQGIVITTDRSGAGLLLMTHDAGRTWSRVSF